MSPKRRTPCWEMDQERVDLEKSRLVWSPVELKTSGSGLLVASHGSHPRTVRETMSTSAVSRLMSVAAVGALLVSLTACTEPARTSEERARDIAEEWVAASNRGTRIQRRAWLVAAPCLEALTPTLQAPRATHSQ